MPPTPKAPQTSDNTTHAMEPDAQREAQAPESRPRDDDVGAIPGAEAGEVLRLPPGP